MKKVDLIHGGWLNAPNGASSVLRSFYDNKDLFLKNGIDLSFYTLDKPGDKFSSCNVKKSPFKNRMKELFLKSAKWNPIFALISIYLLYIRHCNKLVSLYKKSSNKASVVFIHDIFTAYAYLKYCKKENQRIVLVLHNNGETWNMLKIAYPSVFSSKFRLPFENVEKMIFQKVDKIGFVSQTSLNVFVNQYPQLKSKAFFIYNGIVNRNIIHNESEKDFKYNLCCVGTLSDRKGQLRLIQAFLRLPKNLQNDIHITLVGDGPIKFQIMELVQKNNLQEHVLLTGTRNDVDEILVKNDLFILPSNDEGLPISILEAMRAGLPIISTKIAGIPELVIDAYNGMLILPDVDSIYRALAILPSLDLKTMGANSRKLFQEKFTIDTMINNYSSIFAVL